MKYTASRLSEGNKIFPAEINIESNGVTVRIPGFFSGQSRHLDFQNIGEVSVVTPLVGYSTISFYTAGTRVTAHGFTTNQANQIKYEIETGKSNTGYSNKLQNQLDESSQELAEAKAEKIEYELEQKMKLDNSRKPWLNDDNFYNRTSIDKILFPNELEDIEKTIERIIKTGIEEIKQVLGESEAPNSTVGEKNFLKPYSEEYEKIEACIERASEGIKKLKRKDVKEYPKLKLIIADVEESLSDLKEKWLPRFEAHRAKRKKKNIRGVLFIVLFNIIFWGGIWLLNRK